MVATREQAWANALKQTTNTVGTCQLATRLWFGVPSVGDVDRDGDADAVDGWASEPLSARHPGDRNPPLGVPLRFAGGRKGFGHSMMSGPQGQPGQSTDMRDGQYAPGHTGRATIADIEQHMGLRYLGWSETIDGIPIPYDVVEDLGRVKKRVVPKGHGEVPKAIRKVERAAIRADALGQKARAASLRVALAALRKSTTQKGR